MKKIGFLVLLAFFMSVFISFSQVVFADDIDQEIVLIEEKKESVQDTVELEALLHVGQQVDIDNTNQHIDVKFMVRTSEPGSEGIANTGEDTRIWLFVPLLIISAIAFIAFMIKKPKRAKALVLLLILLLSGGMFNGVEAAAADQLTMTITFSEEIMKCFTFDEILPSDGVCSVLTDGDNNIIGLKWHLDGVGAEQALSYRMILNHTISDALLNAEIFLHGIKVNFNGADVEGVVFQNVSIALSEKTVTQIIQEKGWAGKIRDIVDGVPIPVGFTASSLEEERNKNDGLVIIDSGGNEFVWVPAKEVSGGFRMRSWQGEVLANTAWNEIMPTEVTESIDQYGGFYMGRYEASDDGNGNVQVKKLQTPWTLLPQGPMSDTSSMLYKSSVMYGSNSSVVSHLVYGAEWDTTLQWLIDGSAETGAGVIIDIDNVASNSTSWGNYKISEFDYMDLSGDIQNKPSNTALMIPTGSTPRTRANNIYDMAGNAVEWTQERNSTGNRRTSRGGNYLNDTSAGNRVYKDDNVSSAVQYGFRVALYIKCN